MSFLVVRHQLRQFNDVRRTTVVRRPRRRKLAYTPAWAPACTPAWAPACTLVWARSGTSGGAAWCTVVWGPGCKPEANKENKFEI